MKKLIVTDPVRICGSDLISGTLDEKCKYMGYDRYFFSVHIMAPVCIGITLYVGERYWSANPWLHVDTLLKTIAHGCIQSLRGVSMTNSEGLWPQLICCAPHLSMVPLISDKV